MLEEILPSTVVVQEARADLPDVMLFPQEEAVVGRAVEKRRREFATARACARKALAGLGLPLQPISAGAHGEPLWPLTVVGSITHCAGYRACALAHAADLLTVGIDAEPSLALPDGVLAAIARAEELTHLCELARIASEVHWDRLLFSAKESTYKALFPITKQSLNFENVGIIFDPSEESFTARLFLAESVQADARLATLGGRWLMRDGLLLTAVTLP